MSLHSIVDANIHRFKEGARVLEDIARFLLNDFQLFTQLKDLKHRVRSQAPFYTLENDIGGSDFVEQNHRQDLMAIALANGYRMQEAARVLEEMDNRHHYKSIRFTAYQLHAELIQKLKKYLKHAQLKGIYALCDPRQYDLKAMAHYINAAEIAICQIRMKEASTRAILSAVQTMRDLLHQDKLLIVNDHLDIALLHADGVHLGQDDLPVTCARKIVPPDFIIGVSCHNLYEAQKAIEEGASYIAVGCLFPSSTKENVIPVDFNTLREIVAISSIPVCAIGGINDHHADEVWKVNVSMVAMQSALWENLDQDPP